MIGKLPRESGFFRIVLMLTAVALLSGMGGDAGHAETETKPAEKSPVRGAGDTLRLHFWQAPTILNPHLSAAYQDWAASRITYEPLASYDKDGNLIPFLAAEIPTLDNGGLAEDGKSVTWKLRQRVRWSDGEPFTAQDVLFTYEFITDPAVGSDSAPLYSEVKGVEVIDNCTVRIHFKDVNPAWSLAFVGTQGMIIPEHLFAAYKGPDARKAPGNILPVGTGPYRVVAPGIKPQEVLFLGTQLVETNKIIYEPNPYFREADKPFFSRVELRGGGTVKEAARLVLETGDADFAVNLMADDQTLSEMEAKGKGKTLPNPTSFVERLELNFTDPNRSTEKGERSSLRFPHPFFSDKRVRQAISYGIDRNAIAQLYGKGGRPTGNLLVSPAKYQSLNASYDFNTDLAKSLLAEAGWVDTDGDGIRDKNGTRMKILFQTTSNALRQEIQKIIQKELQALQIEVEIKVVDSSTFFSNDPTNPNTVYHFHADIQEYADGNPNPDPGAYMQFWLCSEIPQQENNWSGQNMGRWCNPLYDRLYEQSTKEMDPEKRTQLFIQMNDLIVEEVAVIPLVHRVRINGVDETLRGMDFTPWDAEVWNIKDWRRVEP